MMQTKMQYHFNQFDFDAMNIPYPVTLGAVTLTLWKSSMTVVHFLTQLKTKFIVL